MSGGNSNNLHLELDGWRWSSSCCWLVVAAAEKDQAVEIGKSREGNAKILWTAKPEVLATA